MIATDIITDNNRKEYPRSYPYLGRNLHTGNIILFTGPRNGVALEGDFSSSNVTVGDYLTTLIESNHEPLPKNLGIEIFNS